jgi:outer membrane immunogenic protein
MKLLIAISTAFIMALFGAGSASADTWSGPYFGIHAGKGWSGLTSEHPDQSFWTRGDNQQFKSDLAGVLKGGQAGYNYQVGRWVIGGEVSYSDAKMGNSAVSPYYPQDDYEADINGIFSAIVRLGYDVSGTLIYLKGGYASAKIETSNSGVSFGVITKERGRHTGPTVGAGIEHKLSPRISLGVDYNIIDLGSRQATLDTSGRAQMAADTAVDSAPGQTHTIMVRLNFHVAEWFTFH